MLPPGELIYMLMSLVASSLWRYSNCATVILATVSSIGVPMKMMRSFNRREKMSQPRSPRGVDSTTLGTYTPRGSRISRVSLTHLGSLGLKMLAMLAPSYLKQPPVFSPLYDEQNRPSVKNIMCRGFPQKRDRVPL